MVRFVLRRLAVIPLALLAIHFLAFTYAHLVPPLRAARTPYFPWQMEAGPLLPAYAEFLVQTLRGDLGTVPTGQARAIVTVLEEAVVASLGLLALALALSTICGLLVGMAAVYTQPPRTAEWLTILSAAGQSMPSFYIGTLFLLLSVLYAIWRPGQGLLLPMQGFGWDAHLVVPTLALMLRPTVQIAQVTAELLVGELHKQYVVTARSVGHTWRTIRWRHTWRNIAAAVMLTISGALRHLVGELLLVEWLFAWPGVGSLLVTSLIPGGSNLALLAPGFLPPPGDRQHRDPDRRALPVDRPGGQHPNPRP